MVTILKVEHDGELRRKLFQGTPGYAAVVAALSELWPDFQACLAKYEDDEGDACTLAELTFDDFLSTASDTPGRSVLRLRLLPASTPKSPLVEQRGAEAKAPARLPTRPAEPAERPQAVRPCGFGDLVDEIAWDDEDENENEDEDDDEDDDDSNDGDSSDSGLGSIVDDAPMPRRRRSSAEAALWTLLGNFAGHCRPHPSCRSTGGASVSAVSSAGNGAEDMDANEKVQLVLAAFDADGDGRLRYGEWAGLIQACHGPDPPLVAYHLLCAHLGIDAREGLDAQDMARAYAVSGTLDWDFAVARRTLEESDWPVPRSPEWACRAQPAPCF